MTTYCFWQVVGMVCFCWLTFKWDTLKTLTVYFYSKPVFCLKPDSNRNVSGFEERAPTSNMTQPCICCDGIGKRPSNVISWGIYFNKKVPREYVRTPHREVVDWQILEALFIFEWRFGLSTQHRDASTSPCQQERKIFCLWHGEQIIHLVYKVQVLKKQFEKHSKGRRDSRVNQFSDCSRIWPNLKS